jgi:hypothetical protein
MQHNGGILGRACGCVSGVQDRLVAHVDDSHLQLAREEQEQAVRVDLQRQASSRGHWARAGAPGRPQASAASAACLALTVETDGAGEVVKG